MPASKWFHANHQQDKLRWEISASNAFTSDENKSVTKIKAGIYNIFLTSEMHHEDTDIMAQMSDVKINLTQPQYFALMSPIQATAASATADSTPGIAPVAKTADGEVVSLWTAMGLAFTVANVTVDLFDTTIEATETTQNNSIGKFSLKSIHVN
ncbi:hypothetical protein O181_049475 [Austropuccinia psidii MF-1]|uniref:Uncharacterized protein n=1 Tax=Austropuccinia psidii MF-1 TaxID=1389203 RepID=A0A9Q3DTN1_9BASI|nr:hypothetical protein [Austropuccinia psidii MF-1]